MDVERPIEPGSAVNASPKVGGTSADPERQRRDQATAGARATPNEEGSAANDTEVRYGEDESPA